MQSNRIPLAYLVGNIDYRILWGSHRVPAPLHSRPGIRRGGRKLNATIGWLPIKQTDASLGMRRKRAFEYYLPICYWNGGRRWLVIDDLTTGLRNQPVGGGGRTDEECKGFISRRGNGWEHLKKWWLLYSSPPSAPRFGAFQQLHTSSNRNNRLTVSHCGIPAP